MAGKLLFSAIEAPTHPKLTGLYHRLGIEEQAFSSMRKLLAQLKKTRPDYVAAEFFYGYGNNYAGVNISNLDVMLMSLKKFAPQARVIVFVNKAERHHVDKLNAILPLHGVFTQPIDPSQVEALLRDD